MLPKTPEITVTCIFFMETEHVLQNTASSRRAVHCVVTTEHG